MGGCMKKLIKLFIVIPLLFLGGCYTQMYFPVSHDRSYDNEDEYSYNDEEYDSSYTDENYDEYNYDSDHYYNDNFYGHRRFF